MTLNITVDNPIISPIAFMLNCVLNRSSRKARTKRRVANFTAKPDENDLLRICPSPPDALPETAA